VVEEGGWVDYWIGRENRGREHWGRSWKLPSILLGIVSAEVVDIGD
jgi:hypothetical protein